jgi:hypothetical protein
MCGAIVLTVVARAPVEADDPVSTSVSFNREIVRIMQRKCEPCHAPGGLAMSLSDYRDVRTWGRAIREELVEHRMPPAIVARGYRRYQTDPSLNAREIATFLAWLDGGMPRGDEADRPPPVGAGDEIGGIDDGAGIRLALPPQTVAAGEGLVIRRVTIDAGAAAGRAIARVQFRPDNRRVLRGAIVYALDGAHETWIGAWLPWQHAIVPPASNVFHVPAGATIVVELHYRGGDVEMTDRSAIDLAFAPATAASGIGDVVVEAKGPAGSRVRGAVKLSQPATVWAIHPATDASVTSLELRAERPDKSFEVLMWIPQARPDWPVALVLEEPISLPAGSTISLVAEIGAVPGKTSPPRVTLSVLR